MSPTVTASGLVKAFGSVRALDGVDLELGSGITGLLGPNGAGKTTLLRILATVQPPDGGALRLLGDDPMHTGGRTAVRRRLGYMPQEPGFHRAFSVFDFVDYVAILKEHVDRRARHDEVRRVIAEVGLEAKAHVRIRKLSGGMRRRVALAQALLGDPDLLILDEPTAGLDPELRFAFRDLVSRLGDGRVVLLSTQQTEDVAAVCQRIVVLNAGRVCFAGTPADLASDADGRVWLADERQEGAHLVWRTAAGRFRHLGDPPAGADLIEPTLEDGYLLLTGPHTSATVVA